MVWWLGEVDRGVLSLGEGGRGGGWLAGERGRGVVLEGVFYGAMMEFLAPQAVHTLKIASK